jgi:competence protein ComFC
MMQSGSPKCPALVAYHLFWVAVDWIFPPHCGGCNKFGERWCDDCQQKVIPLMESCCESCGTPLGRSGICEGCRDQPPFFNSLRSCYAHLEPARQANHQLKYQRDIGLAEALAVPMAKLVSDLSWPVDLVTSVPLSTGRIRQRGYNQASMLALPVALSLAKPFRPDLLKRHRETASQVGLSAKERKLNVSGAFAAKSTPGKVVLVIDDVITTGSTMNACAQALRSAGAAAVYGLSFARAIFSDQPVQSYPFS